MSTVGGLSSLQILEFFHIPPEIRTTVKTTPYHFLSMTSILRGPTANSALCRLLFSKVIKMFLSCVCICVCEVNNYVH